MSLNSFQAEFIQSTIGRKLTDPELAEYAELNSEIGCFGLENRPPNGRKTMILYTACTGYQVRAYLQDFRPEIYEEYDIQHILIHALALRCGKPGYVVPELIPALFKTADFVLWNPLGGMIEPLSNQYLNRLTKPDCKLVSYAGPHQGCWWVICQLFGEQSVRRYLDNGLSADDIWGLFKAGTFDPGFEERLKMDMMFQKGYQHGTDSEIYEFIRDNYRRCKMFFTFNHATCHLIACAVDGCLGRAGYERLGLEHAVSVVPADHFMVGHIYPETHYEWDHYKFEYPMRWQQTALGGIEFYKDLITLIEKKWREKKTAV